MAVVRRPCALSAILRQLTSSFAVPEVFSRSNNRFTSLQNSPVARAYSSYTTSQGIGTVKDQYEFEVHNNPPEWKYVERLLPLETVPPLKTKEIYPSGFIPPKEEAANLPYFISRSKNHQIRIYLSLGLKGSRRTSRITKIEGDIWALNDDIKHFLKTKHNRYVETKVNEFTKRIDVKGDYVLDLKDWAHSKGF